MKNDKNEDIKEEKILRHSKKYYNRKRKYKNKEMYPKNSRTTQNSKSKNNKKRTYTKRTDLIQERIKILQLAKKSIEEDECNKTNKNDNSINGIILTDNEKDSNDSKNNQTRENNILFHSLKLGYTIQKNDVNKNNLDINNKYIKKISKNNFENSGQKKPKIFKKYQTSTFIYKRDNKRNEVVPNDNEQYNNTFKQETKIENHYKENKLINEMDLIGKRTGFIYQNKTMKDKTELRTIGNNSPKKIDSYVFVKAKSKKKYKKINLLIKSENNINKVKNDIDKDKNNLNNKEKDLIYFILN